MNYTKLYCFNLSEQIHLKKPVVQIQYMVDGVVVKALDGTIFNGSYVILAIPPPANVSSDIGFSGQESWVYIECFCTVLCHQG